MSPVFYEGRDSVKAKFAEHKREPAKRTTIGNDVWIGQNVLIKQGVKIGTGAVVGMGSIVTKDIVPYSVVAGNPAKEIRKRFDSEIIKQLLRSNWWDFDDNKLKKTGYLFNNPVKFINELRK
jgi:acetyltransferase-like isoleucine patch superfamily enzyme